MLLAPLTFTIWWNIISTLASKPAEVPEDVMNEKQTQSSGDAGPYLFPIASDSYSVWHAELIERHIIEKNTIQHSILACGYVHNLMSSYESVPFCGSLGLIEHF